MQSKEDMKECNFEDNRTDIMDCGPVCGIGCEIQAYSAHPDKR